MRWSNRSTLYKWTLVSLWFMFLVYGLAFGAPTWFGNAVMFKGLWLQCTDVKDDVDFDKCSTVAFGDDNSDWMDGVRGVWAAGGAFYLLAVLMSLCGNFCCGRDGAKDYGVAAIWALIAGLDGCAGVVVVAVKTADEATLNHYRWGYFLACASSGLTVILSIVLFLTRNVDVREEKVKSSRTADYVYNGGAGKPYTNGGYARDDMPMQHTHAPYPSHQYSMYRGDPPAVPSAPTHSLGRPGRGQQPYTNGYTNGYAPGGGGYGNGYAGGYEGRAGQRASMAESADLSNGYSSQLVQAEHSLARQSRGGGGHHDDYPYNRRY